MNIVNKIKALYHQVLFERYCRAEEKRNYKARNRVLKKVVKELKTPISRVASSFSGPDKEDIRQECALIVCQKFSDYNPKYSLSAFFFPYFKDVANKYKQINRNVRMARMIRNL